MWKTKSRIIFVATILIFIVVAIVLYVFLGASCGPKDISAVDVDYVSELHTRLDPSDIPELKEIIMGHKDNYVRERAVFVLADIATRKDTTEDVIDFLKEVVNNEDNDEVRSAAYTNLYMIRELYPLEIKGELEIVVEGDIKEGGNITVIAIVSSIVDVERATMGIKRIRNVGDEGPPAVWVIDSNSAAFCLRAGESVETPFSIQIGKEGLYIIPCVLRLYFDRVDYQTVEKNIYLNVGKTEGLYEVVPVMTTSP